MYQIIDFETENHEEHKRFASPFSSRNWIVAQGWKVAGDKHCSYAYYPTKESYKDMFISPDVKLLVGHNIKFDLLHIWNCTKEIFYHKEVYKKF